MKFIAKLVLLILLLCYAHSSAANTVYVSAAGGTFSGGTLCNGQSTQTPTYFNASSNWTSGTPTGSLIGPGTTVVLCGTFTGTADQTLLTFQGSGSSGSPITLLFDNGVNLTAPYWATCGDGAPAGGAIYINGKSYIVVNGQNYADATIQNTANGTGLTYEVQSCGISINASSNITVENLTFSNLCIVTEGDTNSANCAVGIYVQGGASNITITNNLYHDMFQAVFYLGQTGDGTGLVHSYSTGYHIGYFTMEFFTGSGSSSAPVHGFDVIGNEAYCVVGGTCNWVTGTSCGNHLEFMHFYGGYFSGTTIADNYFHDSGTECVSDMITFEPQSGSQTNFLVYNNVFEMTACNPAIDTSANGPGSNGHRFYNNTFTGPGISCAYALSDLYMPVTFENNIDMNFAFMLNFVTPVGTGGTINYNSYYNWSGTQGWGDGYANYTLAEWQATSAAESFCSGGCDVNSVNTNPNINPSAPPYNITVANGVGTNLTSLGIAGLDVGAPQTFGVNYACGTGCVARPATGAWDAGAYQFSSASSSLPNPPSALTATVQQTQAN